MISKQISYNTSVLYIGFTLSEIKNAFEGISLLSVVGDYVFRVFGRTYYHFELLPLNFVRDQRECDLKF